MKDLGGVRVCGSARRTSAEAVGEGVHPCHTKQGPRADLWNRADGVRISVLRKEAGRQVKQDVGSRASEGIASRLVVDQDVVRGSGTLRSQLNRPSLPFDRSFEIIGIRVLVGDLTDAGTRNQPI